MSEFIVSARKYRPQTFDSVVGQQSITTTLKNSIKNDHLAHAYLFCGPRGVGKTTCARIFAKTINCQNLTAETEACNECESCKGFNESSSYNIHELDAASNNSVEDIRTLIDQVRIPPQIGDFSIYIIDEVHMLSAAAFNAFLKTLEEPPKHARFILATTEKHKILPTILSRCQIFDFNRIKAEDAVDHLASVAQRENIEAEPEALNVIALKADGGMRDALSIFDQVVSFCGNNITYQGTIENLNVLDYEYYFKLTDCFYQEDYVNSLLIFDEILDKGFDGHNFINGLCEHFRDLLVCRDQQTVQLLEVGATIKERYVEQAKTCSQEFLYKALDLGSKFDINYKSSKNKRLHVELALLQFCNINKKKNDDVSEDSAEGSSTESTEKPQQHRPKHLAQTNPMQEYSTVGIPYKDIIQGKTQIAPPTQPAQQQSPRQSAQQQAQPTSNDSAGSTGNQPPADTTAPQQSKPLLKSDFSVNGITSLLKRYAESLGQSNPKVTQTLLTAQVVIEEANVLTINLTTQAEKDFFDNMLKATITTYLKENVMNADFSIATGVAKKGSDAVNMDKLAKFNRLKELNEDIDKLKDKFDLDLS